MIKSRIIKTSAFILVAVLGILAGNQIYSKYLTNKASTEPDTIIRTSIVEHLSEDTLANDSQIIIEGDIKELLPSKWNTKDGKEPEGVKDDDTIFTDNLVEVTKVIKGEVKIGDVLKVRTNAGEIDTSKKIKVIRSDSDANFSKGEKVLLFLTYDNSGFNKNKSKDYFALTGGIQGKYTISSDKIKDAVGQEKSLDEFESLINKKK